MSWIGFACVLMILTAMPSGNAAGDTTTPTTEEGGDPAIQSVAEANNTFALDLYAQIRDRQGNLFVSPYSIDAALMMARAGAGGETADEMTKTLKLPEMEASKFDMAMSALARRFSPDAGSKGYELHVANAIWGQTGMDFLPQYVQRLKADFAADANSVDFANASDAARTINDWVATQTHDRIRELIDPGSINSLTKLILTSAIYFKGTWSKPFNVKSTRRAPWHENYTDAPPASVSMMFQRGAFDYAKADGLAALQMRYIGDDLAMLVLLPDDRSGLTNLEKSLDRHWLDEIVGELRHEHEVQLSFPKFKEEATCELSQTLAIMGMPTAFSAHANFSGMDGHRDLLISQVIHKAFVQVDEVGTEAAAASGVTMRMLAVRSNPVVFNADHPFLFLIRDVKTGTILFMGRMVHPAE